MRGALGASRLRGATAKAEEVLGIGSTVALRFAAEPLIAMLKALPRTRKCTVDGHVPASTARHLRRHRLAAAYASVRSWT